MATLLIYEKHHLTFICLFPDIHRVMNLRGTGSKHSCYCQIQEGRKALNFGAGSEERGLSFCPFLPANSNRERDEEGRSHLVSRDRSDTRPRALGYPEQDGVQAQWGRRSPQ